ncbi:carboxylating nicotinate-nucleotide diphosphorylase [Zavarzinella formosa]|uniref:carboxylating nicotinate-nucleotide diphosphorylase n=1 Tax=Zavarzinella formosa TaxID=360055 RepID=UPI00031956C2|nr:carboxylating nicotinate-nucleotide diphosphorylase [Zavarzinella formosa]
MPTFSKAEQASALHLIDLALLEDFGDLGDITSVATIPEKLEGKAAFAARTEGVLAGLAVAEAVARRIDPRLKFEGKLADGDRLTKGAVIATIAGPMRGLLAVERTALNFLQRLSGVATLTQQFVDTVGNPKTHLLDTRKTTPGWRLLEKYAVRCGGGRNHRIGLYDAILIKDNHLAAIREAETHGSTEDFWKVFAGRLAKIRADYPGVVLEVEVDSLEQFDRLLPLKPDIILLDNMTNDQLRTAVATRNRLDPAVQLEASGGVSLETIRGIADTGVDRISVGAMTHSAKALDIGLDYLGE